MASRLAPVRLGDVMSDKLRLGAATIDILFDDGPHWYWSTHCRHGNHQACLATELAPGVPRKPAQCKTCASPCLCGCHSLLEAGV